MSTTQNAPAVKPDSKLAARKTFNDWVNADTFKVQLAKALPKHLTPDRFIRVLMTASIKNPLILECTQETIFKSVYDCAALGLELNGRQAHLIPYKNNKKQCYEAQLIVDYKGMVELAYRSGCVASIHADTVHENDIFEVDRGQITRHVVDYKKPRGAPYAAYCLIRMNGGGEKSEIMTQDEIYDIRARSKAAESGPWVTDEKEMWKKTVAKRAFKWVPSSPEIRDAFDAEDSIDINAEDITDKRRKTSLTELISGPAEASAPAPDREPLIAEIESYLLDASVSDSALLKEVTAAKLVENPDGLALFELPTADLAKVRAYVASKAATSTAKGE